MSTLRGRGRNLEIAVERALAGAAEERAQFAARPDFFAAAARWPTWASSSRRPPSWPRSATRWPSTASRSTASAARTPWPPFVAELELAYLGAAGAGGGRRRGAAAPAPAARGPALRGGPLAGGRLRRRPRGHGPPPQGRPGRRVAASATRAGVASASVALPPARRARYRSGSRHSTTAARCAAVRRCTTWAT